MNVLFFHLKNVFLSIHTKNKKVLYFTHYLQLFPQNTTKIILDIILISYNLFFLNYFHHISDYKNFIL